jgi:hypothetical protein
MPAERSFYILYPDTYWVGERKVRAWLSDAIANGECDGCTLDPQTADIEDVIAELHDTGNVTFAAFGREYSA